MNREEFISQLEENQDLDIEIVRRKNDDYVEGAEPFQNFRMVEDASLMPVEKVILARMSDKMQRVFNLIDSEASVEDESVADTLSDLRNYANTPQVYLKEEKQG